jgi:hypothetical protein
MTYPESFMPLVQLPMSWQRSIPYWDKPDQLIHIE